MTGSPAITRWIAAAVHAIAGAVALVAAVALWWFLIPGRALDVGSTGDPAKVSATTMATLALWPIAALAGLGAVSLLAAWALHDQRGWAVPLAGGVDGIAILLGGLAAWDGFWNLAVPLLGAFLPALGTLGLPGVRMGASPTGSEGASS